MNNLGNRIRVIREDRGLLLRQVAAFIEVDTALMSKFERGERKIQREQIPKIAQFLRASEDEFILLWIADKIIEDIKGEPQAMNALKFVESKLSV